LIHFYKRYKAKAAPTLHVINMSNEEMSNNFAEYDCDRWCQTDGETNVSGPNTKKMTKFVWKIKNFSQRPERNEECIFSDVFSVFADDGTATKWKLKLNPEVRRGLVSVDLHTVDTKVRASYDIYLWRKTGEDSLLHSIGIEKMFDPSVSGGACRPGKTMSFFGSCLTNDTLTIVCRISVYQAFKNSELKPNQRMKILADFEDAYNLEEPLGRDVTVTCGDASFLCSKFVMMARSPVFKSMFESNMKESETNEVHIEDLEPHVVKEMLKYIHTGSENAAKDHPQKLLAAADRYQLDDLRSSCEEKLRATLNAKNSIEILILSDLYTAPKLKEDVLKFISKNMKFISTSCDWKKELAIHPSLQSEIIESLISKSEM